MMKEARFTHAEVQYISSRVRQETFNSDWGARLQAMRKKMQKTWLPHIEGIPELWNDAHVVLDDMDQVLSTPTPKRQRTMGDFCTAGTIRNNRNVQCASDADINIPLNPLFHKCRMHHPKTNKDMHSGSFQTENKQMPAPLLQRAAEILKGVFSMADESAIQTCTATATYQSTVTSPHATKHSGADLAAQIAQEAIECMLSSTPSKSTEPTWSSTAKTVRGCTELCRCKAICSPCS